MRCPFREDFASGIYGLYCQLNYNDPVKRRAFIRKLALGLSSVAGALAGISIFRQFSHRKGGAGKRFRIGNIADFPVDTYTFLEEHQVYIYRDHESVKAVSAVCTHLGCTVQRTAEGFECPCHGSCFADDGSVVSGPAPTSLAWYRMERAPDGKLVVDLDRITDANEKCRIS